MWKMLRACGALALCCMGLFVGEISAQTSTCSVSSETGYDYEITPETGFTFHWTVNDADDTTSFKVIYDGTAWIAVGFSADGEMTGSDSVIGLPGDETVQEYDLTATALAGVVESSSQEITGESISQTNSTTTMEFTRPLEPDASSKEVLSVNGDSIIIWAYGSDNDLGYHSSRGDVTVSGLSCGEDTTTDDDPTDDDLTDDDDPAAEATSDSCASSDPDYEYEYSPHSDYTLFWSIVEDESAVAVKVVYNGNGWVGVGWSDDGDMAGSDAVVGLPGDGTALEYYMPDRSQPEEATVQDISEASIAQGNGVTTLTFIRPLSPSDGEKHVLSVSSSTEWLYAWGGSNEFNQHTNRGSMSINLGTCDIEDTTGGGTSIQYAHGWLMVLGWSVFLPLGIMSARFTKSAASGFRGHWMFQTAGSLLIIAGFVIAVYFTEDDGIDHFSSEHAQFGLFLTIVLCFQVAFAICRPSVPPVQAWEGRSRPPWSKKSCLRKGWELIHRPVGYIAVIVAFFQCLGGIDLVDVKDVWTILYLVLVAIIVVSYLIRAIFHCLCASAPTTTYHNGPQRGEPYEGGPVGAQAHK